MFPFLFSHVMSYDLEPESEWKPVNRLAVSMLVAPPPRPPPTTLRGEYVEEIIAEVGTQGPRSMLVGEEQSGGRSISGGLSSGRFH